MPNKNGPFKMKNSPAKLFGFGKSARRRKAIKHEEEERERIEKQKRDDASVGYTRGGKMPFMQ